jgi:DNA modification methylase
VAAVITPYYQDHLVTLYHGDCLEVDAWLEADVLVTDPPYGIGWEQRGYYNPKTSGGPINRVRNVVAGDGSTDLRDCILSQFGHKPSVVFGSWKALRPQGVSHRLIWDKNGAKPGPLNAPFYSVDEEIYIIGKGFRRSSPPQRSVITTYETRTEAVRFGGHPTPKPVRLMEILIDRCPPGVIADPFAGSGSTLIAARNLGRKVIGMEIEEQYCEIAATRLSQGCFDFEEQAHA